VWQLDAPGRAKLSGSALSAAASLRRRQAPSGSFRVRIRINFHSRRIDMVLRLSSLWETYSATLASADQFRHAN
jgi:hypothetical protein